MVKCLWTMFSEITHSIQRPGGAHLCILPAITICWQLPFPSPTLLWKSMYITQRQPESSITNQRSTPAASLFPCVWNYSPTKKKKTFNHLLVRQIGGEYLLLTTAPIFWHFRVSSTTINFNGSPMISIFFQPITILALLYWYVSKYNGLRTNTNWYVVHILLSENGEWQKVNNFIFSSIGQK